MAWICEDDCGISFAQVWLSCDYSHPEYIKIKLRSKLKAWLTASSMLS